MSPVRRVVIDVLKPHDPPLVEFTKRVADSETVEAVTSSLIELDQEVQNVKITSEGSDVNFEAIETTIENLGGTVHSVDQVSCGDHIAQDRHTLQD